MRKLGVSVVKNESTDIYKQIPMIKASGFDCFFFSYQDGIDVGRICQIAEEQNLEIETVHLPFSKMNSMWENKQEGTDYLNYLFGIIAECASHGITKAVLHITVHTIAPPVSDVGIKRFKELFAFAQNQKVHLCVENLEPQPHLQVIMDMLPDYHGFCWDCGHNLCYTPLDDMMDRFGDRLLCTHIHDNRGISCPGDVHYRDDLHLLPFDGNLNWRWFADKIKNSDYMGPLTLELSLKSMDEYSKMPLQEFFNDAYRRGCKLISMTK